MRRAIALIAGLACLFAIAGAAIDLNAAVRAHFASEALARHQLALARGESWVVQTGDRPSRGMTAPALATLALSRATDAQAVPEGAMRQSVLNEAMALADLALRRRPDWGEGLVSRAYLRALRDGELAPGVRDDFRASYARAPYLKDAANWRVQYGLRHWALLSPTTRQRLVDELIWLVRLRPVLREPVFAMARATPAYQPVMLRWREVRALDRDLRVEGE